MKKSFLHSIIFVGLSLLVFDLKSEPLQTDVFELNLDQLGDIEVSSAAKKPQKISLTAASVFVIKQEDIKRSGVTTIPDALRMAPGVQVAKLDANKWAISIRGFNDIFSNKLLILMDGRTVYSPFFGGAYWDTVDTVLKDIERIEIVRGPGGTLWGSNAVNGVINIITKHAKETEGLSLTALAGNKETGQLSVRYGGEINPETNYRVYAKGFEKDNADDGVDDWRMGRVGFRIDSELSKQDTLTIQSDVYAGEEGERAVSSSNTPPFGTFASKTDVFGANVLLRWQRDLGNGSDLSFQAYYDHAKREHFYITDARDTMDLDFQHRFKALSNQELIWGLGFRYLADETVAGTLMSVSPDDRVDQIYSAFVQDEISLIDEQLILTLGTKIEHNSYTGFEYQPSARLLWKFFEKQSVWGSVSRAVRIPSRMEQDVFLNRAPSINILGSQEMDAEELIAYELGYRFLQKDFSVDMSFFYNDYDNLRTVEIESFEAGLVSLILENQMEGETYGLEIASSWQVNQAWKLAAGYSFTQIQLHLKPGSTDRTEEGDEGDTPQHQFDIRSFWQVTEQWQLDTSIRYVDRVKASNSAEKPHVEAYVTIDLRIAWQALDQLELSIIGQNLLGKHREFRGSTIDTQATDVEPSIYFQADFNL